jgi:hypothetical protein
MAVVRFPIRAFAMALIASAILVLAGLGGYLIRGAGEPASSQPQVVTQPASGSNVSFQPGPAFDTNSRRGTQY